MRRVLLKLSGEALAGAAGFGIDAAILVRLAEEIAALRRSGAEIALVLGGGNLFRGAELAAGGLDRVTGDHMGMLATVMNGLAFRDVLRRAGVPFSITLTASTELRRTYVVALRECVYAPSPTVTPGRMMLPEPMMAWRPMLTAPCCTRRKRSGTVGLAMNSPE